MSNNVHDSQFADRGSDITNSKNNSDNNISIKKIRTEALIISFVVGTISLLLAFFVYEHWLK